MIRNLTTAMILERFFIYLKQNIMKLELKHLAPYLSYGLGIKYNGLATQYLRIDTLHLLDLVLNKEWKPILRPLSDLERDEYDFIWEVETDHESICRWIELDDETRVGDKFSYHFWSLLFEHHFDVFGLIENNLAIDINTIE